MKKIILILFIIPLTIFGQKYQEPDFINLLNDEYNESEVLNIPEFSVIGWSKGGLFAYRIIYSYDGIGLDSDLIVVYNLKNDKVVDLIYLYGGENDYNFDYEDILNFNYNIFWRYNQRRIDKFLSDYNIIQNFSNKFYTNEYIDKYEIILKNRTSMCEEPDNGWEYGKEYEHEYRLLVGNSNTGYKKVANGLLDCGYSSMNFVGYFKSPIENRMVVILSSHMSFKGDEDWRLHFFGCSLDPSTF